jgi:Na+/H+ antiporter NhaD/arsenite permease-like protein
MPEWEQSVPASVRLNKDGLPMTLMGAAALLILVLTYAGVAIGRIPGLRLDRAGIALLGGAAMIAIGALSMEDAYRAINFDTITLLLGMMIVVAHLKVSGAFRALGAYAIEHAHAPFMLLVMVTLLTGVLSAFLVNDAICLVMAPMVVHVTRVINRNPIPYLIATATASNCGSVATITGNPQNMVIGALSGISYPAFRPPWRRLPSSASSRSSSSCASSTGPNSRAAPISARKSIAAACCPGRC